MPMTHYTRNSCVYVCPCQLFHYFPGGRSRVLLRYRAEKPAENVEVVEANIVVESYASAASLVFNQSHLGFSKERGGISF